MSQEQSINTLPTRQPIRVRLEKVRARRLSMIGGVELVGLVCAILLAVFTLFLYFYLYLPASSRLNTAKLDLERLQGVKQATGVGWSNEEEKRKRIQDIHDSMQSLEGNYLVSADSGRMSLYTELNRLIRENGLRNSAGPTYATLDPIGTKDQGQAKNKTDAKWQSVYPGIAVTVTVEGPYQNIRHFVRDIETSRQFLIINAVELEGLTEAAAAQIPLASAVRPATRTGRAPTGAPLISTSPRGTMVSLQLDLTIYFRRGGESK